MAKEFKDFFCDLDGIIFVLGNPSIYKAYAWINFYGGNYIVVLLKVITIILVGKKQIVPHAGASVPLVKIKMSRPEKSLHIYP